MGAPINETANAGHHSLINCGRNCHNKRNNNFQGLNGTKSRFEGSKLSLKGYIYDFMGKSNPYQFTNTMKQVTLYVDDHTPSLKWALSWQLKNCTSRNLHTLRNPKALQTCINWKTGEWTQDNTELRYSNTPTSRQACTQSLPSNSWRLKNSK